MSATRLWKVYVLRRERRGHVTPLLCILKRNRPAVSGIMKGRCRCGSVSTG
jgi:hypothetical protein